MARDVIGLPVNEAIGDREVLKIDHSPSGRVMRVLVADMDENDKPCERELLFSGGLCRREVRRRGAGNVPADFFDAFVRR